MENPIPFTSIFATPADHSELIDWVSNYSGSERVAAMTAAHLALNLAHKMVERAIAEAK